MCCSHVLCSAALKHHSTVIDLVSEPLNVRSIGSLPVSAAALYERNFSRSAVRRAHKFLNDLRAAHGERVHMQPRARSMQLRTETVYAAVAITAMLVVGVARVSYRRGWSGAILKLK